MPLLALKLCLSPALVLLAWWLGRRFGPTIGGRTAALPIVASPILLVIALTQGPAFASQTAKHALIGITPLATFGVAYSWVVHWRRPAQGGRRPQAVCALLFGWAAFLLVATGLQALLALCFPHDPAQLPVLLSAASAGLTLMLAPRCVAFAADDHQPSRAHSLRTEIGGRVLGAMVLVGTLTTVAAQLGAVWSGLLASFPVALSVVLVASHLCDGADTVRPLVCGYLAGLWGYLVFLALFALLLPAQGLLWAMVVSASAAPLVQWGHHRWRQAGRSGA